MICCKIVTNYNSAEGQFGKLWENLGKKGNLLWENGSMYFADCSGDITQDQIGKILKKCGYTNYYIDIYTQENQPQFETEVATGWLCDKLIKINYHMYEQKNQEMFKNVSKGLDQLDEALDKMIGQKKKRLEQEDNNGGEEEK